MAVTEALFDLGDPTAATPPTRRALREAVILAQGGRCANSACACAPKSLDVVQTADGKLIAFCRSCRLRWDAPTRATKARATRALGVQLRLRGIDSRSRTPVTLPSAKTVVDRAMHVLGASTDGPPATSSIPAPEQHACARAGAWALVASLRRAGFVFAEEEDGSDSRSRACVVLPSAKALVDRAMRVLGASTDGPRATSSAPAPEQRAWARVGAWALVASLRRAGFVFAEEGDAHGK